jgi:hypothetical protein
VYHTVAHNYLYIGITLPQTPCPPPCSNILAISPEKSQKWHESHSFHWIFIYFYFFAWATAHILSIRQIKANDFGSVHTASCLSKAPLPVKIYLRSHPRSHKNNASCIFSLNIYIYICIFHFFVRMTTHILTTHWIKPTTLKYTTQNQPRVRSPPPHAGILAMSPEKSQKRRQSHSSWWT